MTDGVVTFESVVVLSEERTLYNTVTMEVEYKEVVRLEDFAEILEGGNFILDAFIPMTMKWIKQHPEHISGFLRKM